jgi:hypothetical protein
MCSAIALALKPMQITVLINRSFCTQDKWQAIAFADKDICQQNQNRDLQRFRSRKIFQVFLLPKQFVRY